MDNFDIDKKNEELTKIMKEMTELLEEMMKSDKKEKEVPEEKISKPETQK